MTNAMVGIPGPRFLLGGGYAWSQFPSRAMGIPEEGIPGGGYTRVGGGYTRSSE